MTTTIVNTRKLRELTEPAECDYRDLNEKKQYGLTIEQLIELVTKSLDQSLEGWCRDTERGASILRILEIQMLGTTPSGMKFQNINEYREFYNDIQDENLKKKSMQFQLAVELIPKLSDNYAWEIYKVLHTYLDPQLDSLTIKTVKDYDDSMCPDCKLGIEVCHCGKWPDEEMQNHKRIRCHHCNGLMKEHTLISHCLEFNCRNCDRYLAFTIFVWPLPELIDGSD